jgi:3-isopropylmalate/(R)-2-methylmalate dehydratase small subunit
MNQLEYRDLIEGNAIPLKENDVDTDRIIPARFMKCVTFEGLGEYAFYDARFEENGTKKNHPFNDTRYQGGSILLTGRNFGCGSSREHAPQALMRFGIKAIIGISFAEIFIGNCAVMGIPCVSVSESDLDSLIRLVTGDPKVKLSINLKSGFINAGSAQFKLSIKDTFKKSFIEGTWDSTSELLLSKNKIEALYQKLPYTQNFR